MSSIPSEGYNSFADNHVDPIQLREGQGVKGVLQNLEDGPIGLIMAEISGLKVELPSVLAKQLRPLMGQDVRVALLFGKYYAAKCRRRQTL